MTTNDTRLQLPIEPYTTGDYLRFGEKIRRKIILWATHLGDDVAASPGTPVQAIGDGEVVWSEMRLGSQEKRNWGGIIVVKHHNEFQISNFKFQNFYSVYGHMKDLRVKVEERVQRGQTLGVIADGSTPENGWWKQPHLHFAIYTGPWKDEIVPGYKRPEEWGRTKLVWWHNPQGFIRQYNTLAEAS